MSSAIRPPNSTNRDIAIPQLPVTPGKETDNGFELSLAFIFVTEEKISQYPIPLESKFKIVTRAPLFAKYSYSFIPFVVNIFPSPVLVVQFLPCLT